MGEPGRFSRDDDAVLRPQGGEPEAPSGGEYEGLLSRLHDTTLQVLEYIARGGDFDPETFAREVKLLAAREATALRELIEGRSEEPNCELEHALRRVVAEARTLADHDIRLIVGPTDDSIEGPEVGEIAAATREALTNARKHASARVVTVYVEVSNGHALVTVKDDGVGADLARFRPGLGVQRSIVGRMARVGGHARFTSSPGAGMMVSLEYPAEVRRRSRTRSRSR
jgi:signal transduction histidine kinase